MAYRATLFLTQSHLVLNASHLARHDSGASGKQRNAKDLSAKDAFMTINRRTFLAAASGLVLSPAFAEEAPPALAAYERETGGRIGLYAENLASGAKIAWRAEERFVMCSTFKASLAAFVLARVDRGEDRLEDMVAYGAAGSSRLCAGRQAEPCRGRHVGLRHVQGHRRAQRQHLRQSVAGALRRPGRADRVLARDGRYGLASRP